MNVDKINSFPSADAEIILQLLEGPDLFRYLQPRFESARQLLTELEGARCGITRAVNLASMSACGRTVLDEIDPDSRIRTALGLTRED